MIDDTKEETQNDTAENATGQTTAVNPVTEERVTVKKTATKKAAAKKAPAKKKVAAKKTATKKAKPASKAKPKTGSVSEQFGFREGGDRSKMLIKLHENLGHFIPVTQLRGLERFLPKVPMRIKKKKLPFRYERKKDADGKSVVGLFRAA